MSNYHFNINFKQKCKAESRQILKLDSLRSATSTSFQPKGLEHILIKRMCDGKLKQKDVLNQLFSKQSSQAILSKQKGFYYEDKREVASVKEFFHFYKLVSSEKNNIQRQEFNEQLQKKTEKIIHILHDKNQSYKERQQTLSDEGHAKSLHTLTNQSSKEFLNPAQVFSQINQHKYPDQAHGSTRMYTAQEDVFQKKSSLDHHNTIDPQELQRKSSLKVQSQRRFVPFQENGNKNYFISPPPSTRLIGQIEEIAVTIPTSPSGQPLGSPLTIPSSQFINTLSTRVITEQPKNTMDHQNSLPLQPNQGFQPHTVFGYEQNVSQNQQNKGIKQVRQYRVKDLNLSDISQGKQQGSTLQSNTASRRFTNKIPTPVRSNQSSTLNKRAQSAQSDKVRFTPILTNYSNQNEEKQNQQSNMQSPIEFQNSKIQQLMNDFNDSVLELEPSGITEQSKQIQVQSPTEQSEIQHPQKSFIFKGVSRNNSIASQPYFEFPASHQNLREVKTEKQAQVSFSLPQSGQKENLIENAIQQTENKFFPSSMVHLQLQNSLNESLTSIPRGRIKSYSPSKEFKQAKSTREFNYFDDDNPDSPEKEQSIKQFMSERQKSLQFTMKHADKFLHSHDSLAGTKANIQSKDKKLQFIGQVFKSATNFDIIISNQINQSIEKRRKKLHSSSKLSINSKLSHDSNQHDKIKDIIHDSQLLLHKDGNQEKETIRKEEVLPYTPQESDHDLSLANSITKKSRISSDIIRSKSKREIIKNEDIEEVQEDQDELPKQAFLNVQKLKQENLLQNVGKQYDSKAIQNLGKDIKQNIQKIDSLLSKKAGLSMFLDKERLNSPLSYTQKRFHTRAEVGKHYDVQKYFDIQKTLAIDYSNAKKNIKFQQFDNKVYTKNTDYVRFFH